MIQLESPSPRRGRSAIRGGVLVVLVTITPLGLAICVLMAEPIVVRLIAVVLGMHAVYAVALVALPRLRSRRPPALAIRIGFVVSAVAFVCWLASVILHVQFTVSPREAWAIGDGEIAHVEGYLDSNYSGGPALSVSFSSSCFPFGFGGSIEGDAIGGAWREFRWPLWPLLLAATLPTWLLWDLRHERVPVGRCPRCEYDLTGNVSGWCPECGTLVEPSPGPQADAEKRASAQSSGAPRARRGSVR